MNVLNVLKHYHIPFTENHPEVSSQCFGIDCPFCGDSNKHLGIFKDSGVYTCWKCKSKGSLFKLIATLKGVSYDEFSKVAGLTTVRTNSHDTLSNIFEKGNIKQLSKKEDIYAPELPSCIIEEPWLIPQFKHLLERLLDSHPNITWENLVDYHTGYVYAGEYIGRLIIPIYNFESELIGWTGRDLTGTAYGKYIYPKGFKAHDYIYCSHTVEPPERLVIVEGIFDAWSVSNINPNYMGVALLGKSLSDNQTIRLLHLISYFHVMPKISIMLDGDTSLNESCIIADKLMSFFDAPSIIRLSNNIGASDPASVQNLNDYLP